MVLALPSIAMIVGAAELCRGDYKKASALTSQQDGATKSLWMLAVTPTVFFVYFLRTTCDFGNVSNGVRNTFIGV